MVLHSESVSTTGQRGDPTSTQRGDPVSFTGVPYSSVGEGLVTGVNV